MRLVIAMLSFSAIQIALGKPPQKDKEDTGFVGPYDFGAVAELIAICDDPNNGPSVAVPPELGPFVPAGTKPIEWHKADLNLDGRPDYVLVVERDCEERTLLVVVRRSNGSLYIAASNNRIIGIRGDGGTYGGYDGTLVAPGAFTVSQVSGSGPIRQSESVTFAWSARKKTWVVEQDQGEYCEMGDCMVKTDSKAVGLPFESY